jgi:hypothetical protein
VSDLVEYLYVDQRRLDAYVEQITSPLRVERVPLWQATASLSGLSASAGQSSVTRPLTTHEQVKALLEHLEREHAVARDRRVLTPHSPVVFKAETCRAARVVLPLTGGPGGGGRGLALWATQRRASHLDLPGSESRAQRCHEDLLLLEDYPRSDEPGIGGQSAATTFLSWLAEDLPDALGSLPAGEDPSGPGRSTAPEALLQPGGQSRLRISPRRDWLERDSLEVLRARAGRVGPLRLIWTLYRVRDHLFYGRTDVRVVGTCAYPIIIAESGSAAGRPGHQ